MLKSISSMLSSLRNRNTGSSKIVNNASEDNVDSKACSSRSVSVRSAPRQLLLDELCDDVCIKIFRYLSISDRKGCRLVCRRFRDIIDNISSVYNADDFYQHQKLHQKLSLLAFNKERYLASNGLRAWLELISHDNNGKSIEIFPGKTMQQVLAKLNQLDDDSHFAKLLLFTIYSTLQNNKGSMVLKFCDQESDLIPHDKRAYCFHPAGNMIIGIDRMDEKAVLFKNINTESKRMEQIDQIQIDSFVHTVRCSSDGRMVLTAQMLENTVRIYFLDRNYHPLKDKFLIIEHENKVTDAHFFLCVEEQLVLTASESGIAKITSILESGDNYETGVSLEICHDCPVVMAVPSPNGQFIITVDRQRQFWLTNWKQQAGQSSMSGKKLDKISLNSLAQFNPHYREQVFSVDISVDSKKILTHIGNSAWFVTLDSNGGVLKSVLFANLNDHGDLFNYITLSFIPDGNKILICNSVNFSVIETASVEKLEKPIMDIKKSRLPVCKCSKTTGMRQSFP